MRELCAARDQIKVQGNSRDVFEFSKGIIYNAEKHSAAIHHGARQLPGGAAELPGCGHRAPSLSQQRGHGWAGTAGISPSPTQQNGTA